MIIKFKIDQYAKAPTKAHSADAGFDLYAPKDCYGVILPHTSAAIDTGTAICIPDGYCGLLVSKSGLNVKHGIKSTGLVDAGYTGNIVVKLYNDSDSPFILEGGMKISQIVILPIPDVTLEQVSDFGIETERGANGFGSSGK